MDRAPLLYSSWEYLSLLRHLSNSSEPTRAGVREGESARTNEEVPQKSSLVVVHCSGIKGKASVHLDTEHPYDIKDFFQHFSLPLGFKLQ